MATSAGASQQRPLGLVTGASSGIGLELARQLVEDGFDLLIVAEDEAITSVAEELSGDVVVKPIRVDLATQSGNNAVVQIIDMEERPLAVAAINAGIGVHGPLIDTALDDHLRLIAVNIVSTVHLGQAVARRMVDSGSGFILFTSSTASQMPGPYDTTYAASKSFVQSFCLGLREELHGTGVSVTALMPGPTDTAFFQRAHMELTKVAEEDRASPAEVARAGLAGLWAGEDHVTTGGWKDEAQSTVGRLAPDEVGAKLHSSMTRPSS